jgi:hypothetical protein
MLRSPLCTSRTVKNSIGSDGAAFTSMMKRPFSMSNGVLRGTIWNAAAEVVPA